jgi:hypothetical protein
MPTIRWGSEGFQDAKRWPQLPSGTVRAGYPIRKSDDRYLPIALWSIGMACSQIDADPDNEPPPQPGLFQEMAFALQMEKKPEREWTAYEKRRMRQFDARIASLLSCTAEEGRRRACREIALRSRK